MSATVHIGIAGWSYADWRGVVYPRGCKDELRWVARFVDLIEINTTFYRVPAPELVAGWVTRTAETRTAFTAKVPQRITHERRLDPPVVAAFRAALAPLVDSGRLVALLAQFNYRFRYDRQALAHLEAIAAAFGDLAPLVVELRHASWSDRGAEVRGAGFDVARLDYPTRADSFDGSAAGACERVAYFRIHGRNRAAWYSSAADRDAVYDYEYDAGERDDLIERLAKLVADARSAPVFVVANNHFRGKAVKLAMELKAARDGERVAVPEPLVDAYPDLAGIARGVLF